MTVRKKIIITCSAFYPYFNLLLVKADCVFRSKYVQLQDRFQRIQEWSVIQLEKKKENYTVLERNFDSLDKK
jgi:hypothetical protein